MSTKYEDLQFATSSCYTSLITEVKKGKAVPLHALEALGGEEV
jgi:hypothetical protein